MNECLRFALVTLALYQVSHALLERFATNSTLDLGTCDVVPVVLSVSPPRKYADRCMATQVLTFGCRGQCRSYVKIADDSQQIIDRMCRCCEPTRLGVHLAEMSCTNNFRIRVALKFALECLCRPCVEVDITPQEVAELYPEDRRKWTMRSLE